MTEMTEMIGWLVMISKPLDALEAQTPWGTVPVTITVPGMIGWCPVYESKAAALADNPGATVYEIGFSDVRSEQ